MYPVTAMAYDIKQNKTRLENMLRVGIVTMIYPAEGLVDVAMEKITRKRVPVFTPRAGDDKTYWMPSVGEQGLVISPSGDLANAMFMPALNSVLNPVPKDHEKWTVRQWKDGAIETYDKEAHEYILLLNGDTHRKVNRSELQDKRGDTEMNMDGTEAELKNAKGHFKVDNEKAELFFSEDTKVILNGTEAKMVFGSTEITLSASGITLKYGASRIEMNATGIIFTGPRVENTTPILSWNGTPTTPIAWVAVS